MRYAYVLASKTRRTSSTQCSRYPWISVGYPTLEVYFEWVMGVGYASGICVSSGEGVVPRPVERDFHWKSLICGQKRQFFSKGRATPAGCARCCAHAALRTASRAARAHRLLPFSFVLSCAAVGQSRLPPLWYVASPRASACVSLSPPLSRAIVSQKITSS